MFPLISESDTDTRPECEAISVLNYELFIDATKRLQVNLVLQRCPKYLFVDTFGNNTIESAIHSRFILFCHDKRLTISLKQL